jgi:hypothetical protein
MLASLFETSFLNPTSMEATIINIYHQLTRAEQSKLPSSDSEAGTAGCGTTYSTSTE